MPSDIIPLRESQCFETPYSTLAELECNAQAVASTTPYYDETVATFLRGEPAAFDWNRAHG